MAKRTYIAVTAGLLIAAGLAFNKFIRKAEPDRAGASLHVEEPHGQVWQDTVAGTLSIEKHWELPDELFEISGITWYAANKLACIQDELGVIYIFDLQESRVVQKMHFAPPGDFEGITFDGKYLYALRSDGIIYKIDPAKPANSPSFSTGLEKKQNCEGLCYDKSKKRLLIAIKGSDPVSKTYKGIYACDPVDQKMEEGPVAIIDISDPLLEADGKPVSRRFEPSAIAVNPVDGKYFVLTAADPTLMILSAYKNIHSLLKLEKAVLPKAEGITFSPYGELFISSEGGKGLKSGLITRCKIN